MTEMQSSSAIELWHVALTLQPHTRCGCECPFTVSHQLNVIKYNTGHIYYVKTARRRRL